MKASNTHPSYYSDAVVTCVCSNSFTTGSTLKDISVDVCAACHPFFTGEMRFVDTLGNVDKFMQKRAAAADYKKTKKAKQAQKQEFKSLKDMLTVTKVEKPAQTVKQA